MSWSGRACTEFNFIWFFFFFFFWLIPCDRIFSRAQRICRTAQRWYWTVSIGTMLAFINVLPIMVFGNRCPWTLPSPFCVSALASNYLFPIIVVVVGVSHMTPGPTHLCLFHRIYIYDFFLSTNDFLFVCNAAPPEITVERSWIHASEGYDIELACIVHGDVTSDVSEQSNTEKCGAPSTTQRRWNLFRMNRTITPLVSVHCRLKMRLFPCTINFMAGAVVGAELSRFQIVQNYNIQFDDFNYSILFSRMFSVSRFDSIQCRWCGIKTHFYSIQPIDVRCSPKVTDTHSSYAIFKHRISATIGTCSLAARSPIIDTHSLNLSSFFFILSLAVLRTMHWVEQKSTLKYLDDPDRLNSFRPCSAVHSNTTIWRGAWNRYRHSKKFDCCTED